MATDQSRPPNPPLRLPKLEPETLAALAATALAAALLLLTAIHAGPLWRDEVNTANVAQMPTLRELWKNLPCESFPPLWPLLLRLAGSLGLAGSDIGIRVLGLYVGFAVLGSFWLCARWFGCRAPILSLALLGCLPTFVFIMGANRAYGLASCLLLLTFGTLWRMIVRPSPGRVLAAGCVSLLFAQCVYYDIVFLAAMLAGGALVTLRWRHWKTLAALTAIGAVCALSLAAYLPIIRQGTPYARMNQLPSFGPATLWDKISDALTARGSGEIGRNGPEIWLWIALLLAGTAAGLLLWRRRAPASDPSRVPAPAVPDRHDLAFFCAISVILGLIGLVAFLFRLHYWTQPWYYVEWLCLCGIGLDGIFGANWPALRPWGWTRIGFLALLTAWTAPSGWQEAHTRRSDLDLIAALLEKDASPQDVIVVQTVWEGITFHRYYHGAAPWVTVPPVASHLVHRNDLVLEQMHQPEPMTPVLRDMTNALQSGHSVWLLGNMSAARPGPLRPNQPAEWVGTYLYYWTAQISSTLLDHALKEQVVDVPAGGPICCLENLPLIRFMGFRAGAAPTNAPASTP